jgi:hypothetical protein
MTNTRIERIRARIAALMALAFFRVVTSGQFDFLVLHKKSDIVMGTR